MSIVSKDAELFVGVVARIGVDNRSVTAAISKLLAEYGYDTIEVKVTDALRELQGFEKVVATPANERYSKYIDACNEVRQRTGRKDIFAQLAVSRIIFERKNSPAGDSSLHRTAFVINQLKRQEESDLLRSLYGENYIQISCHAKAEVREARLAELFAHDHPQQPKSSDWEVEAKRLIRRDEAEEDKSFGQRLREVFPHSDVVIDASTPKAIIVQLDRFFRALFGDPRVTPSVEEYGMQLARTAALRSSDLSRQVGASILNQNAEIQALGCNEVPRAGGGTYWEGDPDDAREFQRGKDSNDERKREVLLDLAARMVQANLLRPEFKDVQKLRAALLSRDDSIISDSQLMDSLEYGRTIHAEMNAITDAARGGHAIRGCILFSNTFPCHNCAKHIVASGIARVSYLVPYPKSYAEDLFPDSIAIEPASRSAGKVAFEQFIGIVGPMYGRVFEKQKWKGRDGAVPPFKRKDAVFIRKTPAPAYREAEAIIAEDLGDLLSETKLLAEPKREGKKKAAHR